MIALLAAAAVASVPNPAQTAEAQKLQELQVIWNQTCGVAAYGSYNDLCNSLKAQIKDYTKKQGKKATLQPPPVDTMPTVASTVKPKG